MEFMEAMQRMESGYKIKRPNWEGYLFLDVDGNIRHAGAKGIDEQFWTMDINKTDWETRMPANGSGVVKTEAEKVDIDSPEVTAARLESLMDSNASHIKRLYYLEEIIEGQHKAFKKIAEDNAHEMEETRKALDKIVKHIPRIQEAIKEVGEKFYKLELLVLINTVQELVKASSYSKVVEKKMTFTPAVVTPKPDISPEETKEMEETREKYNTRLALKAKSNDKPSKKVKKGGKKE